MNFIRATGNPEFLASGISERRFWPATFTRETIKSPANVEALLRKALARKEDKLVIAQVIAERLWRRARADWALAMATQAARKLNYKDITTLISWSCMVYGALHETGDAETFKRLRVATIKRLLPRRGNPQARRLTVALNYFFARVQQVLDGSDLLDTFEPECLTHLLSCFQFRRDSVYPVDKMLYKGVKLL